MSEQSAASPTLPTGGTVRPIVRWGVPVMHRTLEPITEFDDTLRDLVADMVATMYAADGVGLAACQIGIDRSVFVFDCPDDKGVQHAGVVCNPELFLPEGRDRRLDDDDEGCLSLPGAFVACARPSYAKVEGQGLDGSPVTLCRHRAPGALPAARVGPLPRHRVRGPAQQAGPQALVQGRGRRRRRLSGGLARLTEQTRVVH